ncbi:hypothetical protein RhiXN_10660 [Rhizoctonia solani]|uniref:Uncharacterized protein n=1 Tax=Rhizoctonia solani TaxID=456999 RepID=A0A8H8P5M5_9AGAM|nr:uncharacterized protein RhiXN_10660 [Rhizoctonia solani]QRW24336.1 hypothetical protein RhiXN_10660 [Rhizoctonia solani]
MSERASISKDPVLPPSAPRRLASRSPSTLQFSIGVRETSVQMYAHESRLTRSQDVPPSFAYPTPGTGRKNDLEPASAPRHNLRGICDADVEDSDSPMEGSITTSRPVFNKVVGTNSAKHTESLQRNDESKDEGGGEGGLEADSSSDDKEGGNEVLGSPRRRKGPIAAKIRSSELSHASSCANTSRIQKRAKSRSSRPASSNRTPWDTRLSREGMPRHSTPRSSVLPRDSIPTDSPNNPFGPTRYSIEQSSPEELVIPQPIQPYESPIKPHASMPALEDPQAGPSSSRISLTLISHHPDTLQDCLLWNMKLFRKQTS